MRLTPLRFLFALVPRKPVYVIVPPPERKYLEQAPPRIRTIIANIFPISEWEHAACIAYHESSFRCDATGAAGERGLFQIHPVHAWRFEKYGGWDKAYDCEINTRVAVEIWREQGWRPWTTASICGLV